MLVSIWPYPAAAVTQEDVTENSRIVKVACYESGSFMSFDQDGRRSGFCATYLEELKRYTNWTFKYVDYPSFEAALSALEAGEVDIFPSVHKTDERQARMMFSNVPLCTVFSSLNVRLDDTRYTLESFSSFNGMRVGIIQGSQDGPNFEQYGKEAGFSTTIVEYQNTRELQDALENGEIDGAATATLGSDARFRSVAQFALEPVYFALPLGSSQLVGDLDSAVNKLQLQDPSFTPPLFSRYFGINTEQDPVFTQAEYDYLATAPTLRVVYDSFQAPLSNTNPETGTFSGVAAQLFDDIARVTNLEFEYIPAQSQYEAFQLIQSGQADVMAGIDRDSPDAAKLHFSTTVPYLRDPMALVSKPSATINTVALPTSYSYSKEAEFVDTIDATIHLNTPKDCLNAVLEGKADGAYIDTHIANYLLEESQYSDLTVTTISDYTNSISIGIAAGADAHLSDIFDRCIQYTDDAKIRSWISQSSQAAHPTSLLDILRQYPLQVVGVAALFLGAIVVVVLYIGRTKLRTAKRIEHLSFTDALTGGWTLSKFRLRVEQELSHAQNATYVVVYLDIARFKSFNAAFGFAAGDQLLIALNQLIGEELVDREYFAHINADEFVLLMHWSDWDTLRKRFEKLSARFSDLSVLQSREHEMLIHAGACVVQPTNQSAPPLSKFIDCARYARDSIGSIAISSAALYSEDMMRKDIDEQALMSLARDAFARGEFKAYYQPKVELSSNRIASLEALARWESPERGLIQPGSFIPLFEKNGFITELDFYILRLACQRLRERLDQGKSVVPIACNFSRLHLKNTHFPEAVRAIIDEYQVPIELIELELTENIVIDNPDQAMQICDHLKELGFCISIDDFGTGYSSLGTLQDLPIDVLKLDRAFLMSSESGQRSKTILEGVVDIAKKLPVVVVVEGTETSKQAAMLLKLDHDIIAQGYLYSKPVPREESDAQLDSGTLDPTTFVD